MNNTLVPNIEKMIECTVECNNLIIPTDFNSRFEKLKKILK